MRGSVRDVVRYVDGAAARRWRSIDPFLPPPDDMAEGCSRPFIVTGQDGIPAGYAVCRHRHLPDSSLEQTWGAKRRYLLTPRLAGPDTFTALDGLLSQWRDHLAAFAEPAGDDTAALLTWPARDVTGVRALFMHGLAPMTVIAARAAPGARVPGSTALPAGDGITIRTATAADIDVVTAMELGVMAYDAQFGGAIKRPATSALVREDAHVYLASQVTWAWLAEAPETPETAETPETPETAEASRAVGLITVQPPQEARWVAGYTGLTPAAYLSTLFVRPEYRNRGIGAALVRHAHRALDEHGAAITLLHHAQVNPLSGPFWYRMGYRPLWTTWEARPASALR